MNTAFEEGTTVRANVTEQGMTAGLFYTVMHVIKNGYFVTYILSDGMQELRINNGHMLLTLQGYGPR